MKNSGVQDLCVHCHVILCGTDLSNDQKYIKSSKTLYMVADMSYVDSVAPDQPTYGM